jgi:hypothetical protein
MRCETKELTKIYEYLSKKGVETSEEELLKTIFEFAAEKEDELLAVVKRKRSEEIFKKWLETPIEIEETDALKEHDLVI